MKYKKIVFIDPATTFGWARRSAITGAAHIIESGVVVLPKDPGLRVMKFWNELGKIITPTPGEVVRQRPALSTFVVWEEAAFSWHGASQSRMYGTWEGILLLFCEIHKIPYATVNVSTIKAYARQQGFFTPRKPKPRRRKGEKKIDWQHRVKVWENVPFDAKPRPRPEWVLTGKNDVFGLIGRKYDDNEVDARWGLEYVEKQQSSDKP